MRNFGILYRYEIGKLVKRKMVWIAGTLVLALSLVSITSNITGKYYVDGVVYDTHYHMMETDREYARKISGRAINQELISEMQEAYRKIPTDEARYSLTDEYQTYARPYSQIFQIVRKVMHFSGAAYIEQMCAWEADETAFYSAFAKNIDEACDSHFLTEEEKSYWMEKEAALKKPFVFGYADGYWQLISSANSISFMILLFCAICLSDSFTREHILRTDQLLLSSRFGKRELYLAKTAAGMSFILVYTLTAVIIIALAALGIYGADGFSVMIQIAVTGYPLQIKAGGVVIMMYALMILAALFTAALVMMLSEVFHSATATLAAVSFMNLLPLFASVPARFRVLAQIWDYLPGGLLDTDTIMGLRLLPFFGSYLTMWQAAPLIYILLGVVFWLFGMRAYQRYQISGR